MLYTTAGRSGTPAVSLPEIFPGFGDRHIKMHSTNLRRSAAWTLPFAFLLCTAIAPAAQADTVPSPWVGRDIGSPLVSGDSSFDPATNAFTITASGSDIWGTTDQFHFVYQQVSGDVDIVARVDSLLHADAWSKAGVMIHSSLSPATISLAASASDPDGTVARVEFHAGSTLLGTDTTAPYAFSWTGVPAGSYTVTAIVYDNAGASTTSAPITVSVVSSTAPSTASFQKSAEHSTLVVSYLLEVFAAGANPDNATPASALNLGKPTPDASGLITVNQTAFFNALPPGSYIATVSAAGSSGSSSPRSVPASFTR